MSFQQLAVSWIRKYVARWLHSNITMFERMMLPSSPDFSQRETSTDFPFLKYLQAKFCTCSCANQSVKEMQQAGQNPCQKALTKNTQSCLTALLLMGERLQMLFLSQSWTVMFQLLSLSLGWMAVSKTQGLTVLILLKEVPSKLTPEAWTAAMLSFHPKQYLHLSKQTEMVAQRKTQAGDEISQNSLVLSNLIGAMYSPNWQMARQSTISSSTFTVALNTDGILPQTSFLSMKFLKSLYSKGGPMRHVGRKLTYPMKSKNPTEDVTLFLNCSADSLDSSVRPSSILQARSEYLLTSIMSSAEAFMVHPPQLQRYSQM